MGTDGIDVDRIAQTAGRLGLVEPDLQGTDDDGVDEVVVLIHISGGLLADVGAGRVDIPRLRVVVVDEDIAGDGIWTEMPTALEDWGREQDDPLVRAAGELPEAVRRELGLAGAE